MTDDEFKTEVLRQMGATRDEIAGVKADVAEVKADVLAVAADVGALAARLEGVNTHLTSRLDAVVVRLDHQDDAMSRLTDKVDRLGAWVRGTSEAAEQAINGVIELSRRLSRVEGRDADPSPPPV